MYKVSKMKDNSFLESIVKDFKLDNEFSTPRIKSVKLKKINIDEHAEKLKEKYIGFDVDSLDIKNIDNEKGLYSTKFGISGFGKRKNKSISAYTCLCGNLTGEIHQGEICDICESKVTNNSDLRKTGVIKLNEAIISPACFSDFEGLIGKTEFAKIIKFDDVYNVNGQLVQKDKKNPFHGIGLTNFIDNYEEVIEYYLKKKKNRKEYYYIIKDNEDALFTNSILVYSYLLRPNIESRESDTINHSRRLFKSNKNYETILKSIKELETISNIYGMRKIHEVLLLDIQKAYNEIYDYLVKEWKGKKGLFRGQMTSTQLDYTARMVITPDNTLSVDEVSMPYIVLLKFFDLQILSILQQTDNISLAEAQDILFKASINYDNRIKLIIDHIIENSEYHPRVLVNRPPSLNPESIRLCKIIPKGDIEDLTMGIPTATLSGFAGDYDGDSLLAIMIHFKSLMDAFKILDPSHQLISRVTGMYSHDYLFIKDMAVGLTMFYENSKGIEYYKNHMDEIVDDEMY